MTTMATTNHRSEQKRRRPIYPAVGLLAAVAICIGIVYAGAWRRTQVREAYLPDLEKQAQKNPRDGRLLALLGGRLIQTQDPQEESKAATVLGAAIAAGEASDVVWQTRAAAVALTEDPSHALDVLRKGQESLHNASPTLNAALTRVQELPSGSPGSAVAAAILPEGPDALVATYAPGSFLDGISSWWGHRHPEQSGFATRQGWAEAQPKDAMAQRLWGLALLRNRRLAEATDILAEAARLEPDSAETHLAIGQLMEARSETIDATNEYLQALLLKPNWEPALLGLGRSSVRAGLRYARPAFLRATQKDPQLVDAWIGLGTADLASPEFYADAVHAFETAEKLDPNLDDYFVEYADALRKGQRAPDAEKLLRRCLTLDPENAAAHQRLAEIVQAVDPSSTRIAEAESHVRAALRIAPKDGHLALQLGQILLLQGKLAEALASLQKAHAAEPRDVATLRVLSRAYARSGQTPLADQLNTEATRLFEANQKIDVLKHDSDRRYLDPTYHQELITLYQQTGQSASAAHEEEILTGLQRDPAGAAAQFREFQNMIRKAVGTST